MANSIATIDTLKDILEGSDIQPLIEIENDIWDRESQRASSVLIEVGNIVNKDFGINGFNIPASVQMANVNDIDKSYQNDRLSVDKTIRIKHDEIEKKNSIAAIRPTETILEAILKSEKAIIIATNDADNRLEITTTETESRITINGKANQSQIKASEISAKSSSVNISKQKSTSDSKSYNTEFFTGSTINKITNNISES